MFSSSAGTIHNSFLENADVRANMHDHDDQAGNPGTVEDLDHGHSSAIWWLFIYLCTECGALQCFPMTDKQEKYYSCFGFD